MSRGEGIVVPGFAIQREQAVVRTNRFSAWAADRKMQKKLEIASAAERDRQIDGIFG
jgi:hypothetical protein